MKQKLSTMLFVVTIVFTSCSTASSKDAGLLDAAQQSFEDWAKEAGIPYKDMRVSVLESDDPYATILVLAWFQPSREDPWYEAEAQTECRKIGQEWQCDDDFAFDFTAEERARQQATVVAERNITATAEAQPTATAVRTIVLEDDFSVPSSRWKQTPNVTLARVDNHGTFVAVIQDGEYQVGHSGPGRLEVDIGQATGDFEITFDVRLIETGGGDGDGWRLRVGGVDRSDDEIYFSFVGDDSHLMVWYDYVPDSNAINPGVGATNRMRLFANVETGTGRVMFNLFANEQWLGAWREIASKSSYKLSWDVFNFAVVSFDNVRVTEID